jgi:hypothetical protein
LIFYFKNVTDEGRTGPKKQIGDPVKRREAYVPFAQYSWQVWSIDTDDIAMQRLYRKSKFDVYLIAD